MATRPPILWDVVEEHLEEAAFLWSQWERALDSPTATPAQVAAGPEARLHAHLDALARLPFPLPPAMQPAAEEEDPGRFLANATAAVEAREGGAAAALPLLRSEQPRARAAVGRALALARRPGLEAELPGLLGSELPGARAAVLGAMCARRQVGGARLRELFAGADPELQVAVLRAVPEAGKAHRDLVEGAYEAPSAPARDAALEAGLLLGLRSAHAAARRLAERKAPRLEVPLRVLAMAGEQEDVELLAGLAALPEHRGAALRALGLSGWPRAVTACLPYLADPEEARRAGEAVALATGLRIEGIYRQDEPEGPEEPVPLELDDLEADLVPPPEAELPLPEPELVARWWKKEAAGFAPGTRHLGGKPWSPEWLVEWLRTAPMRQRHPVALELAVRSRGAWRLDTRAWVGAQRRHLASHRLEARSGFDAPLARLLEA
ncbi:MAG: TIGR02270 family protein [Deltaproteobacteria bacterium]|nr:TIGR02270 family protein [Deltaproteobacteria bacterium]